MLADLVLAEHRGIDNSRDREWRVSDAEAIDLPLRDAETWPSGWAGGVGPDEESSRGELIIDCIYQCGYLAVELLASRVGLRKVADYYMYLEPWMVPPVRTEDFPRPGWRVAFERAFGMTVDEFYDLFEEHRAAGFPDPNAPAPELEATGPQAVNDYIVWKVGDEVSPTEEAEVRETVHEVHDYAVGIGMPRIDRPIIIFLYHNLDSLAAEFNATTGRVFEDWVGPEFAAGRRTIRASRDFIAVNTSAEDYQEYSSGQRKEYFVRRLFDVYRRALTGIWQGTPRDAVDPEGPQWLRAGSREYLTWQALRAAGPASCDPTRGHYACFSKAADTPLSDAETQSGYESMRSAHQHSFLAVELLAEQAGQESIMGYFASLWTEVTWQEAFQTNFGMTVAEFYQLFEERRAAGFPHPRCPPLPPLVTMPGALEFMKWDIGSGVRPEFVEDVIEGTRWMHEYAVLLGMPEIEAEVTSHLYHNQDELIAVYKIVTRGDGGWVTRGSNAVAYYRHFFVNTLRWEERKTSPKSRKKISAHELFHVFQSELYQGIRGPNWMTEGTAESFAFKAMDAAGVLSYDTERNSGEDHPGFVRLAMEVTKPLSEMEPPGLSRAGTSKEYAYYLLAAELLAYHAGERALINYFASLQPGTTWQETFQAAFGMPVEEFYQLFEEHRAAGFPELDVSK